MAYAIKTTPHFFDGTLGVVTETHLLRDPETRDIEVFESREDAEARADALDAYSPYSARHDHEVIDLDDGVEISHLSSEDDDLGDVPDEWMPLARAVAETMRHDDYLTFSSIEDGDAVSDETAFGLRAYAAAPQLAMDVAEALGHDWWEFLDFSPSRRAIRGEFEVPEDLDELADLLNYINADILCLDLINKFNEPPTFGGEKPASTWGVWSWSEDELLVQDSGTGEFAVVPRKDNE